jgi:hypothetical protein
VIPPRIEPLQEVARVTAKKGSMVQAAARSRIRQPAAAARRRGDRGLVQPATTPTAIIKIARARTNLGGKPASRRPSDESSTEPNSTQLVGVWDAIAIRSTDVTVSSLPRAVPGLLIQRSLAPPPPIIADHPGSTPTNTNDINAPARRGRPGAGSRRSHVWLSPACGGPVMSGSDRPVRAGALPCLYRRVQTGLDSPA